MRFPKSLSVPRLAYGDLLRLPSGHWRLASAGEGLMLVMSRDLEHQPRASALEPERSAVSKVAVQQP